MLKEIETRNIPHPTQKSVFELVRFDTIDQLHTPIQRIAESTKEVQILTCMLLNNPAGPVSFLFEEPKVDLVSIYEEPWYFGLCELCQDVFAIESNDSFIGMQVQNIRPDMMHEVMNNLDKDISLLFTPTSKKDFVPPTAGSVRAFLVTNDLTESSWSGSQFLLRQCQLHGGVLGIPLLGKTIGEIESNVALTALSELFSKVIVLGGNSCGSHWESTHLILEH